MLLNVFMVFFWALEQVTKSCFQMQELEARHEVMKQEQEKIHSEQLDGLKHQYKISLEGNLVLCMDGYYYLYI